MLFMRIIRPGWTIPLESTMVTYNARLTSLLVAFACGPFLAAFLTYLMR